MGTTVTTVVGVLVMIALIVGVDVLFLSDHFWLRLIVNIGIVALFGGAYFAYRSRRRPSDPAPGVR